jgi:hypothetical protein
MKALFCIAAALVPPSGSLWVDRPAMAAPGLTTVTVTVVLMPGSQPVPALLERKSGNTVSQLEDIGPDGTAQINETDCSAATSYLAESIGARYTSDGRWKACRSDRPVEFRFFPSGVQRPASIAAGMVSVRWGDAADFKPALSTINAAQQAGDYGTAAIVNAQLGEVLKSTNLDAARGFKEAATIDALSFIMQRTGVQLDNAVTYDPADKLAVPTADAEALIKTYQVDNHLPATGKLDWTTLRSLSPLSNEQIYQLNSAATAKF